MTALNKAQLLSIIANTSKPVAKEIENIGTVYLKKLTVSEQAELSKKTDQSDNIGAGLNMIAFSLCDEDGKRLFDDKEAQELGGMDASTLTALVNAINEVNGFDAKLADVKKN